MNNNLVEEFFRFFLEARDIVKTDCNNLGSLPLEERARFEKSVDKFFGNVNKTKNNHNYDNYKNHYDPSGMYDDKEDSCSNMSTDYRADGDDIFHPKVFIQTKMIVDAKINECYLVRCSIIDSDEKCRAKVCGFSGIPWVIPDEYVYSDQKIGVDFVLMKIHSIRNDVALFMLPNKNEFEKQKMDFEYARIIQYLLNKF